MPPRLAPTSHSPPRFEAARPGHRRSTRPVRSPARARRRKSHPSRCTLGRSRRAPNPPAVVPTTASAITGPEPAWEEGAPMGATPATAPAAAPASAPPAAAASTRSAACRAARPRRSEMRAAMARAGSGDRRSGTWPAKRRWRSVTHPVASIDQWVYAFTESGVPQVHDLALTMETDFPDVDFPPGTMSPTTARATTTGRKLEWRFESLVTRPGDRAGSSGEDQPRPARCPHHVLRWSHCCSSRPCWSSSAS
jgi:hypothetical protein